VAASCSERRNAAAAQAFFERAPAQTEATPERGPADKAKCFPPARRVVLPGVEHRRSQYLHNGRERAPSHLTPEAAAVPDARLHARGLGTHAGAGARVDA
jgi:transposase-like protein